ncbi:MAG: hypothetical protein ACXVJ7_13905 [Acidimicrobiia bacterium]
MTIPIILILAVLWAAFFLWPTLQRRMSGTSRNSIGDFSRRVTALGSLGGGARPSRSRITPLAMPKPVAFKAAGARPATTGLPMSPVAQKRRRDALAVLAVAAFGSLLLALVIGGTLLWTVQLVADLLFVTFVVALVMIAKQARARRAPVHYLSAPSPTQSSALVLRRTGSS